MNCIVRVALFVAVGWVASATFAQESADTPPADDSSYGADWRDNEDL